MISVRVSSDHILNGRHGDSSACPVALALNEQYPGCKAGAGTNSIIIIIEKSRRTYRTPVNVSSWMIAFDRFEKVKPINFDLTELLNSDLT